MGCHYKCLIYTRMLFYLSVIALHMTNTYYMLASFTNDVLSNKGVMDIYITKYNYFTSWNFGFQIAYAVIALFCDWVSLGNIKTEKKSALPECLSNLRDRFFAVFVWPGALLVSTYFWTFYFYDRSLLYPETFDLVVSPLSNHSMHTFITVIVFIEIILSPKKKPERHLGRVAAILGLQAVYVITMYYVHCNTGIWIYPIFGKLNKCLFGLATFLGVTGLYVTFLYYGQYCSSAFVMRMREVIGRKYCRACQN